MPTWDFHADVCEHVVIGYPHPRCLATSLPNYVLGILAGSKLKHYFASECTRHYLEQHACVRQTAARGLHVTCWDSRVLTQTDADKDTFPTFEEEDSALRLQATRSRKVHGQAALSGANAAPNKPVNKSYIISVTKPGRPPELPSDIYQPPVTVVSLDLQ